MFKRFMPYLALFLIIQTVLRLSLLGRALFDVEFDTSTIMAVLIRGTWFDIVTASFFLIPLGLYLLILPSSNFSGNFGKISDYVLRFLFIFMLLFDFVAEHLFWLEFTTRFNFIAVDYLIYTQEVLGNIAESYPLHWIILSITICTLIITKLSIRLWPISHFCPSFRQRSLALLCILLVSTALYTVSKTEQTEISNNAEATEIAANGIYNLFSAFWNNEISYNRFYAVKPDKTVEHNARNLLFEHESNFVNKEGKDLTRLIASPNSEQHKNVILVVMESMSADYLATFGNSQNITPNLDKLAKEGLLFTNLYATGTRTVRGLEAVTLSIPPTPGQSIIRRPGNNNLFSLGFVFKDRGYDTKFIYGGYGYFDNMNEFFSGNGFDIIDRNNLNKDEINFANVWGVSDEDMFARAIKEADLSFENKKPFMQLIMTTSNHRPFTYPDGRIDIKSHSGRIGGVKYADYSIGKLVESARKKAWFKDTVFIFVADHTAGSGGKAELDPHKYHIPMIFYSPKFIKTGRYEKIASQIDTAPILLGLLNFSYYTKFYGEDVLHDDDEIPHAFISNYQKIALIKDGNITVLAPKRKIENYSWPEMKADKSTNPHIEETITYYQSASWWKEQLKRIPTIYHAP